MYANQEVVINELEEEGVDCGIAISDDNHITNANIDDTVKQDEDKDISNATLNDATLEDIDIGDIPDLAECVAMDGSSIKKEKKVEKVEK